MAHPKWTARLAVLQREREIETEREREREREKKKIPVFANAFVINGGRAQRLNVCVPITAVNQRQELNDANAEKAKTGNPTENQALDNGVDRGHGHH